jgi:hypothetical protein
MTTCEDGKAAIYKMKADVEASRPVQFKYELGQQRLSDAMDKVMAICARDNPTQVANAPTALPSTRKKRRPRPTWAQPQPTGPTNAEIATAVVIGAGIAAAVAASQRPGPTYRQPAAMPQSRCHHQPGTSRTHCGRY